MCKIVFYYLDMSFVVPFILLTFFCFFLEQDGRCSKGKYSDRTGLLVDSQCSACPIGKWSALTGLTSSAACSVCSVGRWSDETGLASLIQCKNCPSGRWSSTTTLTNSMSCTPCSIGKFATATGSAVNPCVHCDTGKYTEETGSNFCKFCIKGTFYVGKIVPCSICFRGKFQASASSIGPSCKFCPSGWLNPDKEVSSGNHHDCEKCPDSLPVSGIGASFCFSCPSGWKKSVDQNESVGMAECVRLHFPPCM